jgi:P27 family predicted phage terminase small subunit
MGRPAKSAALHDLQSTQLRSNLADSHVEGALPRPPKHLTKAAKKSFRGYVKQLASGGRRAVTAGDGALIGILCVTEERWLQALENLRDEGVVVEYTRLDAGGSPVTVEKPNINLKIAEICERSMVAILSKLGLTPKDRETVKPTSPVSTGKEQTEAERLDEEIARLQEQQASEQAADEPAVEDDLLSTIDEHAVDEPLSEGEALLRAADEALEDDND